VGINIDGASDVVSMIELDSTSPHLDRLVADFVALFEGPADKLIPPGRTLHARRVSEPNVTPILTASWAEVLLRNRLLALDLPCLVKLDDEAVRNFLSAAEAEGRLRRWEKPLLGYDEVAQQFLGVPSMYLQTMPGLGQINGFELTVGLLVVMVIVRAIELTDGLGELVEDREQAVRAAEEVAYGS
jgi:hypothetical protein